MKLNILYIFLILLIVFVFVNILLKRDIENFGIYCGRYNLDKDSAEKKCKADDECEWIQRVNKNGVDSSWCTQNHAGAEEHIDFDANITKKIRSVKDYIFSEESNIETFIARGSSPSMRSPPRSSNHNSDKKNYTCHDDGCSYDHDGNQIECPDERCNKKGGGCFHKDSKVKLEDGSVKNIIEIKEGDKILSFSSTKNQFIFSPVVYNIHDKNDILSEFIVITTENSKKIKVTPNHIVPILENNQFKLINADKIVLDNYIKTIDGHEKVTSIEKIDDNGIYTFITLEDYIVVDDMVMSPFGVSHYLGTTYYSFYKMLYSLLPDALYSNNFKKYHRTVDNLFDNIIKNI